MLRFRGPFSGSCWRFLGCYFFWFGFFGSSEMCLGNFPRFFGNFSVVSTGGCYFWLGVVHCKMLDEVGKFHGGSMASKNGVADGWWKQNIFTIFYLVVRKQFFTFTPKWGKWSNLTILQMGWFNHQVFGWPGSPFPLSCVWRFWLSPASRLGWVLKETSNGTWNETSYR